MPSEAFSGAASGAAAGGAAGGPIGALIGGAGGLISGIAAGSGARKQRRILDARIRARALEQKEIDDLLLGEVGRMSRTTPEAEREAALGEFVSQLRAHRASRVGSSTPARGSSRYESDLATTEAGLGDFAGRESDIASRVAAPLRMRDAEALRLGRTETDVQGIQRRMDSSDFLSQLALARAGPDTGLGLAGGVLQGIGYGIAGRAPKRPPLTPVTVTGVKRG